MNRRLPLLVCALVGASSASASIIGTTGAATLIATPPDARLDVITSNTQVFVWNEDQDVTLGAPLRINAFAPGLYDSPGLLVNVAIPAGTHVASHYIHFDAPPPELPSNATGTVRFDADIIGVIVLGDGGPTFLDDSDFLGSGTLYPDGVASRGLELTPNGESFGISPSKRVLSFNLNISIPGDFLRVITLPVPAPGALGVGALAGVGVFVRPRRARGR